MTDRLTIASKSGIGLHTHSLALSLDIATERTRNIYRTFGCLSPRNYVVGTIHPVDHCLSNCHVCADALRRATRRFIDASCLHACLCRDCGTIGRIH